MAKESGSFNPARLSQELAALYPDGVVAAELQIPGDVSLLYPEEAAAVAKAIPQRRGEFAAGRLCARRALAALGLGDRPIPAGADRAPVWPAGVVGSITHTSGFTAAVVAARPRFASLGLDVEGEENLKRELWPRICTAPELTWLETVPDTSRAVAATLVFSAKEAFYKCQYPLTGMRLGFEDACLQPTEFADGGDVLIRASRPLAIGSGAKSEFPGRYRIRAGLVCVGFWV